MSKKGRGRTAPAPSVTRSNRDVLMIVLGVFLVVLFLAAGYLAFRERVPEPAKAPRGPVRNPLSPESRQWAPPIALVQSGVWQEAR